ncbi:YHS domain-containing (seleno)protein [Aestuariivivens insulae]|uniref:YHS domain-containing (seleno)protein n=1 Tax=Aestuariivivens insulae TaxID=1621988 RepID=UPI001F59230E|nr:YHS domain-containing (seleno)protein [Aestuariivivens insulae]
MKPLCYLFILVSLHTFSQTPDYNLKKGYAANGYDVVSYFNNTPKEGKKEFVTTFDGVNYKFSSNENLITFNKAPEQYIPQYGGYCAYAIALKGQKVSINPRAFKIIDHKLYLFYNAWGTNTLELWNKNNEANLLEQANKNWKTIKFKK